MKRHIARWGSVLCLLAVAFDAAAGSFSVAPTRVELKGEAKAATFSLRNAEADPLTVQVSVMAWTQIDGEDVYTATRDILATPPVLTIPPNEERVVRVALRRPANADKDIPYRIFFEEVPRAPSKDFTGLNIALRVGVPIFIKPWSNTRSQLRWEVHPAGAGQWRVDALNDGTAHVQVTGFQVAFPGVTAPVRVSVMKYVLPGSRMSWTVEGPASAGAGTAVIQGFDDKGEFRAESTLSNAGSAGGMP
jgi:fimbrial chaperone protein